MGGQGYAGGGGGAFNLFAAGGKGLVPFLDGQPGVPTSAGAGGGPAGGSSPPSPGGFTGGSGGGGPFGTIILATVGGEGARLSADAQPGQMGGGGGGGGANTPGIPSRFSGAKGGDGYILITVTYMM